MKQSKLMEKYPIFELDLDKRETSCTTVDQVIEALKQRIGDNPKVAYIGVFDHYTHTRALGGAIDDNIRDAKNLIFCFGFALPSARVLAVRPRSIGIADLGDRFHLSFLEPPMEVATTQMEQWCKSLADRKA